MMRTHSKIIQLIVILVLFIFVHSSSVGEGLAENKMEMI